MTDLQRAARLEIESPFLYLSGRAMPWGRLFSDSDNAESYTANYAVINAAADYDSCLDEVDEHYNTLGIVPKVFYRPDSVPLATLRPYFDKHGYNIRKFSLQLMIAAKPDTNQMVVPCRVEVKTGALAGKDYIFAAEQDDGAEYGIKLINRQLGAGHKMYFAYDEQGNHACMALAEIYKSAVYITDVYTTPAQRGKGYGGAVIREILRQAGDDTVFLYASEPNAVRLYERAGFIGTPVDAWWAIHGDIPAWCE